MVNTIPAGLRPTPIPNDLTQPFWDAAKDRRLAIQRCQSCQRYMHPPVRRCPDCESADLKFETVSGRGRIYTYIVIHDTRLKVLEPALPFVVAFVELEEQPGLRVTCNMSGAAPEEVKRGRAVKVTFLDLPNGMVLPDFEFDDSAA